MSKVCFVNEEDLGMYTNISKVDSLESDEDVATLIESFEEYKKDNDVKLINGVVEDSDKFYYMVKSKKDTDFDIFDFINELFDCDYTVAFNNVKFLFPLELSRGVFDDSGLEEEVSTSDNLEEDIATSFLDEDGGEPLCVLHKKTNTRIEVSEGNSIIIGRSARKADFIVRDNGNVGREHCKLYLNGENLMVHDFNSLNGTFVNGFKVHENRDFTLNKGDLLVLADEEFLVV